MCFKCCTDISCSSHKQQRERATWKTQVLNGTTDIQLAAKEKRRKRLPKGRFKEPGFVYLGDTVVIWDIRQCLLTSSTSSTTSPAASSSSATDADSFTKSGQSTASGNTGSNNNKRMKNSVVEDILSRARKRTRAQRHDNGQRVLRNNRKRFRHVIEDLYKQNLMATTTTTTTNP
jgi:hypothetical protein